MTFAGNTNTNTKRAPSRMPAWFYVLVVASILALAFFVSGVLQFLWMLERQM